MTTIALRSRTVDQLIRTHSPEIAGDWADGEYHVDNPPAARTTRFADMVGEFTGTVFDFVEGRAVDVEPLIVKKLVQFSASAILAGSLTHVDELLDDLYTMSANGMTTGDTDIDELLGTAFRMY